MKPILTLILGLFLTGCASDPLMSGLPQDWQGKRADALRSAWGDPTRILAEGNGVEVWEYSQTGEFLAAGEEHSSFRMGAPNMFGTAGGVKTVRSGEHQATFLNVARFKIKNGKIKEWYAERNVDGQRVWFDH